MKRKDRHKRRRVPTTLRKRRTIPADHMFCPFCFGSHSNPVLQETEDGESVWVQKETCVELRRALALDVANRAARILIERFVK